MKEYKISHLVEERDKSLFAKIVNDSDHILYDMLPEKKSRFLREREHSFILPKIKTESKIIIIIVKTFINFFLTSYHLQ